MDLNVFEINNGLTGVGRGPSSGTLERGGPRRASGHPCANRYGASQPWLSGVAEQAAECGRNCATLAALGR
jgi:hypothetical protein